MTDSNTLTVDTGGLMVDGRWVVNEAQTSFAIANGSQAQFRKDLAVLEITVDPSTGVTSLEEKVLQGATATTEAAAADPTYEAGDLYTGLTAVVPIARITLNGLTPTCEALLPSVADLKTISEQTKKLGDSVSQMVRIVTVSGQSDGNISAPNVDGYEFTCWIACVSDGWVGTCYIEKPTHATTRTWYVNQRYGSGGGAVKCYALYVHQ